MTQVLTADLSHPERTELSQALRAVLDALPPASGPLDSALRERFTEAAEALDDRAGG